MRKISIITFLILTGLTCFAIPPVTAAADAAGNLPAIRAAEKERRVERVRRFLQRTLDDLREEQKLIQENIAELGKQVDAITPLESSQREFDMQSLMDWYNGYLDWLRDQVEDMDDEMAQLSATAFPGSEYLNNRFAELVDAEKALEKELKDKVTLYEAEEKRLAGILDQRRLLQARLNDLHERRGRIEHKSPLSEKDKAELDHIRTDVGVVQTEFLSLPQVDEDLLKHYAVMIEWGRWEGEWLALRIEESGTLREVAAAVPRDAVSGARPMEAAYRRAARMYENLISRLNRKIDELDRRQSRVSPAGTVRQMDRSRELNDLYDALRSRFNDAIGRFKVRIGAYNAEMTEIRSGKP